MQDRVYAVGALALLLSACVAPTRVMLAPEVKQQLTEVRAQSVVWQDEIIVKAEAPNVSAALGGGLLGAMIDSSISEGRQNTVQGLIDPFYAAVDDVDFRPQLWNALDTAFKGDFAVKISGFSKTVAMPEHGAKAPAGLASGQGYLQVRTEYTFTPDFARLNILTWATLWKGGAEAPVYANTLFYQSAAVGSGNAASIQQWAADHGAQYRRALAEGAAETVAMLKLDLAANAAETAQAKTVVAKKIDGPVILNVSGPLLSEQKGRVIARHSDGHVYSLAN